MNASVDQAITSFIKLAKESQLIEAIDEFYIRNRLLALLERINYENPGSNDGSLLENMDVMVNYAVEKAIINGSQSEREQMEAAIMDLITPLPSQVNANFWALYQEDKAKATDYFYSLSQTNDYIKTRNIAKNIEFKTPSKYGALDITINLSKPEKDPREIAKERQQVQTNYPLCALCIENEGYQGHLKHAARQNHRIIRLTVGEEVYGFQYSPYVYFNEHSIFLNAVHKPMSISRQTFNNLLNIIEIFPHYFVGSNADLPITGGSILAHDHYQGGRYEFAMAKAEKLSEFQLEAFPDVTIEHLNWPMSVLRLRHSDKDYLAEAAELILKHWRDYSDESLGIYARTEGEIHNTITPIARFKGQEYELDLVLRNNRTSAELPDGIFHPHPDVQHIKKENIGLIEVMGLAILPPRLLSELKAVQNFLMGRVGLDTVADIHQKWALELKEQVSDQDELAITQLIKQALGQKFERILEDAGVFKLDAAGLAGIQRFIKSLE